MRFLLVVAAFMAAQAVTPVRNTVDGVARHEFLQQESSKRVENEMSTTVTCIMMMIFIYFLVHSTVGVIKAYNQLMGGKTGSAVLEILENGADVVNLVPILSVLFLACRLRAVYLVNVPASSVAEYARGATPTIVPGMKAEVPSIPNPLSLLSVDPGVYGLPTPMTQTFMLVASSCLVAQFGLQILLPLLAGSTGVEEGRKGIAGLMVTLREFAGMGVTVGAIYVIYAICVMEGPAEIWTVNGERVSPPVSPAVGCTIILVVTYAIFFAMSDLCKIGAYFSGAHGDEESGWHAYNEMFKAALHTMNIAPMLAVLFLAVRLRAISMGRNGPQPWAQTSFYATAFGLTFAAMVTLLGPLIFGGKCTRGVVDEDVIYEFSNWVASLVFTVLRYFALLCIYVGIAAIIVSVFTIEPPAGRTAPPISTTMICIINLMSSFFGAYVGVWFFSSLKQYNLGMGDAMMNFYDLAIVMFDSARTAVQFAPMVCILFFAARLRAMQITNYQGGPQEWAQTCMHVTTWSILFGVITAFVQPLLLGTGDAVKQAEASGFWWFIGVCRTLALLGVYGGSGAVMVSLFLINRQNADNFNEHITHQTSSF